MVTVLPGLTTINLTILPWDISNNFCVQWGKATATEVTLPTTFTKAYVAVTTMKISSAGTRCVSSLTTSKIEFAGGTVTSSYPVMYVALGSKS